MKKFTTKKYILPALLVVAGCAVFLFAAWSAINSPAMASIVSAPKPQPAARTQPFAQVNLPKPGFNLGEEETASNPAAQIPAAEEDSPAQPEVPSIPPVIIEESPTPATSGIYAAIVPDTPTPEYTAPYMPATGNGERWIDVDLSQQRLYAYEGDTVVNSFIVSTGTWQTPTVTGEYKVWVKLRSAPMSGPGYYLANVPYIMYFYGSYGIHGTYWHNNFGTPMSHGCVNMTIADAEWLYNFASVGTIVNVHY